jgi:AraC family transcriptional regulator of adaptative response / DNA-3-methyladenine glycosylase II
MADAPLRLAYRPPYDVEAVLAFFARRQVRGVEQVDGLTLRRTLAWPHRAAPAGWLDMPLRARTERGARHPAPACPGAGRGAAGRAPGLDLDADPSRIDPVLALVPGRCAPALRLPGGMDGFELAVRVILGQQVTVKAGARWRSAWCALGEPGRHTLAGLTHVFPDAATLAAADPEEIGTLGIVRQRVKALQALARAEVATGTLALHRGAPLEATLDTLRALPGIGDWTAQVIAMRALAWPDAWPASDIGLMNALGSRDPKYTSPRWPKPGAPGAPMP